MPSDFDLLSFVELHIASDEQWKRYSQLGSGTLFDPGYTTEHSDPALSRFVPSQPSPEWHEREGLYKELEGQIAVSLKSGEWIAFSKLGNSGTFDPIECSQISQITVSLHDKRFLIDGRNYQNVLFRKAPETSDTKKLQNFIEIVCSVLSSKNVTKPDVLKLAESILEFSVNQNTFNHVWQIADIDNSYRKKGPRPNKEASRHRDV